MRQNFFKKISKDIAIDIGTANTRILVREKGIVVHESSVVAINKRNGQIIEVGREALKMLGKTPQNIEIVQPLVDGVISDFEVTEKMLRYFFDKLSLKSFFFSPRPRAVVGLPLGVTEVEKKAVEDSVLSSGAREVFLVDNVIAAAVGARLPIQDASGSMVVNLGAGVTEIAVISLSGVVAWKSLRVAGNEMDRDIVHHARKDFNLLIGPRVAEEIKIAYSRLQKNQQESSSDRKDDSTRKEGGDAPILKIRGRDLISGLPREASLQPRQIAQYLDRPMNAIVDGIKSTLEITPPELVADIYQRGLILVGGGALLGGLDKIISSHVKVPVRIIEDPVTCAVRGLGIILEDDSLLKDVMVPTTRQEERGGVS